MLNNAMYLRDQQSQAMWLLLDTIATLRLGQKGEDGEMKAEG